MGEYLNFSSAVFAKQVRKKSSLSSSLENGRKILQALLNLCRLGFLGGEGESCGGFFLLLKHVNEITEP